MAKHCVKQKASVPDVLGEDVIRLWLRAAVRSEVDRLLFLEVQHEGWG